VVIFSVLTGLALEGAVFGLFTTIGELLWAVLAAIPTGLLLGWLAAWLLRFWHEHHVFFTTSMSIILAYGGFLLAEDVLSVSGVICVLMAALAYASSWQKAASGRESQDKVLIMGAFWDYIAKTLTGFLFFMLGVAVGRHEFVVGPWALGAAVVLLFLSRAIVVYGGFAFLRIFTIRLPLAWQNLLVLSGLRGPVSAALVLTLPESFPYKGSFQCLAFVAIAASLIVKPPLIQRLLQRSSLSSTAEAQETALTG
jgi:CPA1 family monovalent cation:H+ antiporter